MSRRHPARTITREIRTRRPLHPGRNRDEQEAVAWPDSIRVADRMTRSVTTVHSDALVSEALELMRSRRIRHLPVVDRGGRLVGIVTDRDLRQVVFDPTVQARLARATDALRGLTVRDVMTWGAVSVTQRPASATPPGCCTSARSVRCPSSKPIASSASSPSATCWPRSREMLDEGVVARPYRWALAYR